jgi:hypothetical protein
MATYKTGASGLRAFERMKEVRKSHRKVTVTDLLDSDTLVSKYDYDREREWEWEEDDEDNDPEEEEEVEDEEEQPDEEEQQDVEEQQDEEEQQDVPGLAMFLARGRRDVMRGRNRGAGPGQQGRVRVRGRGTGRGAKSLGSSRSFRMQLGPLEFLDMGSDPSSETDDNCNHGA